MSKTTKQQTGRRSRRPLQRLVGRRDRCGCNLCRRIRRINRICKLLPPEDADWLIGFHNAVIDAECEQEMKEANTEVSSGAKTP